VGAAPEAVRGEGPQIIQLFGRGVRLKGKGMGLKRSSALREAFHPPHIEIIETLGIFGIKANYLSAFREMLELEEAKSYVSIPLEIRTNAEMLKGLKVIRLRKGADFSRDCDFALSEVSDVKANLDILPKVEEADSRRVGPIVDRTSETDPRFIHDKYIELLDWQRISLEILAYRAEKQWFNVSFTKDDLAMVIREKKYTLYAPKVPKDFVNPTVEFQRLGDLENIVLRLLKNYLDKCYSRKRNEWEKRNLELTDLTKDDDNFPKEYVVRIEESAKDVIEEARKRIESGTVYTAASENDPLPNIFCERHLYQPLLAKAQSDQVIFHHSGLNESERRFVTDLAKCLMKQPFEMRKDAEFYLLRNLTRGKGIGFFETRSFYPDFILWIKRGKHQWIVFIEPHGMVHSAGLEDEKVNLFSYLDAQVKPMLGDNEITLDAYIISATDFEMFKASAPGRKHLSMMDCAEKHLLFMSKSAIHPNPDYVENLIGMALTNT
jgi:hypothetical protein